ncbi:hypothetical protein CBR_g46836 [Chara braunii]|uniref:Uncharacterized protein n=1 Tax=Chara braunii TaxID=69332 RepID=A0A388M120_CHABU|nr:hypothetical protein CBR_g46836 [Chara braunii]|eukprot:GBG88270.1 hypothetical protein CBR_g46836 [Chara braunii]
MADDHGGGQAYPQVEDSSRQSTEIQAPWGSILQKKPVVTVPPMVLKDQPSPPNYWSDLAMQIWDVVLTVEEKLGDFFGVYDSKYQWAVNDYYLQQLKIAEKRRISQEVDQQKISTMENGMCPVKEQRMEMQSGRDGRVIFPKT